MIFIWKRLIFESSSESRRSGLGGGDAALAAHLVTLSI
jgi:hypothetical protein